MAEITDFGMTWEKKMKHGIKITFFLFLACFFCGCAVQDSSLSGEKSAFQDGQAGQESASEETKHEKQILAMDTYMTLTAYGEHGEEAIKKAEEEIKRLDALLSVSSEEGEVYLVNENGSEILSGDTAALLEASIKMYEDTGGLFDITIFPLMKEWGFTDEKYKVPKEQRLKELLEHVDASKILYDKKTRLVTLPEDVQIDFGGIAKGYTSARVMQIFKECGVTSGIVSLGGNVQTCGKKPDGSLWRVGVQNPDTDSAEAYIGALETSGKAVITSGGYERYFEEDGKTYHHILNPKTGYPAESGLISVTIISADGTLADGLSTSLFIMGKEQAVSFWKERKDAFDMILQEENGALYITEGIEKNFTSELDYQVLRE